MKKLTIFIVILFLMSCTTIGGGAISSGTEIGNGYVASFVIDKKGDVIVNASVKLLTSEPIPTLIDSVTTDSSGYFIFEVDNSLDVNIFISTDSSDYFINNRELSDDSLLFDTVVAVARGSMSMLIDDTNSASEKELYLSGTGINIIPSEILSENDKQKLIFNDLPAIKGSKIVFSNNSLVESFTGEFNIKPKEETAILGGVRWDESILPSTSLVALGGISRNLMWVGDSTFFEISGGEINYTINSNPKFDFAGATTAATGTDGTVWLGNKKGYVGYYMAYDNMGMLSTPVASSKIISTAITTNNSQWFTAEGIGAVTHSDSGWDTLFAGITFSQIVRDENGGIWATSHEDLYHILEDYSSQKFTTANGLSGDSISDIALSGDTLWVVASNNIRRVTNSGVVETPATSGASFVGINKVAANSMGVWFSSNTDIYLLQRARVYLINWDGTPFSGHPIIDIYSSGEGSLWLVSEVGLFELY